MEVVKILILISILILYPLFPGGLFCVVFHKTKSAALGRVFLHGSLLCGALFAALSFAGVRSGFSTERLSKSALLLWGVVFVFCMIALFLWKTYRVFMKEMFGGFMTKPDRWHAVMAVAFLIVALVYVVRPFPLETGFVTPEQVVTVLDTGMLRGTDVLTGEAEMISGNWKDQICNLPLFYACLCQLSGISVSALLFSVMPFVVLFAAFCVISLFAESTFFSRKRKAVAFVMFALITVCGNAAYMNTSYGLLHVPYEPMTIFSSIVLPLVLAFVLSREHVVSFLFVVINAVFLAGGYKALAILAMAFLGVLVAMLVSFLMERRGKSWT